MAVIPKNSDNLDFWQPAQCAYADDLAVGFILFSKLNDCASTQLFVLWITSLASFRFVANAVGFSMAPKDVNLCGRGSWRIAKSFRQMQIVRHAKHMLEP